MQGGVAGRVGVHNSLRSRQILQGSRAEQPAGCLEVGAGAERQLPPQGLNETVCLWGIRECATAEPRIAGTAACAAGPARPADEAAGRPQPSGSCPHKLGGLRVVAPGLHVAGRWQRGGHAPPSARHPPASAHCPMGWPPLLCQPCSSSGARNGRLLEHSPGGRPAASAPADCAAAVSAQGGQHPAYAHGRIRTTFSAVILM